MNPGLIPCRRAIWSGYTLPDIQSPSFRDKLYMYECNSPINAIHCEFYACKNNISDGKQQQNKTTIDSFFLNFAKTDTLGSGKTATLRRL